MAGRAFWCALGIAVGVVAIVLLLRWVSRPGPAETMASMGDDFAAYKLTYGHWPQDERELRAHLSPEEASHFDDLASNQFNSWKLRKPGDSQATYTVAGTDGEHPVLRTFIVHVGGTELGAMDQRRPFPFKGRH